MAQITNNQVISWSNNRARTLADQMVGMMNKIIAYQTDFAAQGIAAAINGDTAGASSVINDGSGATGDGRNPVTGTTLINFKAAIDQLVTAWNVTNVAGVGSPVSAVQNLIQVNGSLR